MYASQHQKIMLESSLVVLKAERAENLIFCGELPAAPKTSPMALRVALIIVAVGTACLPHLQGAKTKKPRPPPLTTVSIDIRCAQLPTRASQDAILDHVWARRWASMILSILSWGPGISSDHFLPARQRFPVPMSEKERRYS